MGKFVKGHKFSAESIRKMSESRKGKKCPWVVNKSGAESRNWRGGTTIVCSTHQWVGREKGKASNYICECCKKKKAYDWSNVDHKYKKDLRDYRALCRKCHYLWDNQFLGRVNGKKTK